jgi:tetratricopeptide (TPR) repeat protein
MPQPTPSARRDPPNDNPKSIRSPRDSGYSREVVLFLCLLLMLLFFAFSAFASRMYHKTIHVLADQWFAAGEAAFKAGRATEALDDYRNALVYSPYKESFQFRLAQALAATGHAEESKSYLLNLLSESPGSGPINLELARIAAQRKDDMADTLRYYHAAIYGGWDHDPLTRRWDTRRELCEYLLVHASRVQAEPELIALADNLPPNGSDRQRLASELLLRGQLWNRSLTLFQAELATTPHDANALAGAGTAAFHLHDYRQALDYLSRLPRERLAEPELADMLEASRQVLANDPFLGGLSSAEKAARTARDLDLAESRAEACARQRAEDSGEDSRQNSPASDLARSIAQAKAAKTIWSERGLARFPDRVNDAMAAVFQLENAANACGQPQDVHRALWLLVQTRTETMR